MLKEYPFFTFELFPPGFLVHLGGVVSARSVKLLDRIHNPGEFLLVDCNGAKTTLKWINKPLWILKTIVFMRTRKLLHDSVIVDIFKSTIPFRVLYICDAICVQYRRRGRVVRAWDTLIMLTLRRAEGREFDPRPGQYSRMSFSSDQVTGTVFPHLNMPFLPNSKFI